MSDRLLSSFFFFHFQPAYWEMTPAARQDFHSRLISGLDAAQIHYDFYQVFPLHSEVDLLVWCTAPLADETTIDGFFRSLACAFTPHRRLIETRQAWWGMTRASDYSRGKSAQEIDPLDGERNRYLVVYPFSKTAEWYKMSRDTRQGMMNEHIRIGHQYPQIKQLLLYSTGLQDQEFIVTYETEDLAQFSTLVSDLRGSEARRYTQTDTPVFTAVHRTPQDTLKLFG